jgi:hypothetical protein
MDVDKFETYAVSRGYVFFELLNDSRSDGVRYSKGEAKNANFIGLYNNFFTLGRAVSYQTSNSTEFLSLKKELPVYNFKLYETDQLVSMSKLVSYRNGTFVFTVVTIPPDSDLDRNYVTYQISLYKF